MTIGEGETNRYIVINPGTRAFESQNPGALFVALSRAKSTGSRTTLPDSAWNQSILLNADRICHKVTTSTTAARDREIKRLSRLCKQTEKQYKSLIDDTTQFSKYNEE